MLASTKEALGNFGVRQKDMMLLKGIGHQKCIEDSIDVLEAMALFLEIMCDNGGWIQVHDRGTSQLN